MTFLKNRVRRINTKIHTITDPAVRINIDSNFNFKPTIILKEENRITGTLFLNT